jgi:4-hydroxy-2-oxoheptanedioate aldolase
MRDIKLRSIWASGAAAVNGWLHIPSTWSAEVMAHEGFDSLTIDMQHGPLDTETAIHMMQAITAAVVNGHEVTPLVRVPWNEPGIIGQVLDAGAHGVICPMVNNRAECEQFVGACRYPPAGFRSMGPTRAALHLGEDYGSRANASVITMAMVETATALANVVEIVNVPGLDAIYIGPGDLALTMRGEAGADHTDAEMLGAIETICKAARAAGVVAGIHCASGAYARRMVEMGFQFVTLATDTKMLTDGARAMRREFDKASAAAPVASPTTPY